MEVNVQGSESEVVVELDSFPKEALLLAIDMVLGNSFNAESLKEKYSDSSKEELKEVLLAAFKERSDRYNQVVIVLSPDFLELNTDDLNKYDEYICSIEDEFDIPSFFEREVEKKREYVNQMFHEDLNLAILAYIDELIEDDIYEDGYNLLDSEQKQYIITKIFSHVFYKMLFFDEFTMDFFTKKKLQKDLFDNE